MSQRAEGPNDAVPRRGAWLLYLLPVALTAVVHAGVLHAEFAKDDFLHLYQLSNTDAATFLGTPHGGHLYYGRNAYFLVLHRLFGETPGPYFAIALALHLLNVLLFARVLRRLTGGLAWGLFGAALWGMSPLALGSLAWFSAHGHVLIATCLLWVLDDVTRLRHRGARPRLTTLARWYLLLLVASSSYGVGIAVAGLFFAALYLLWNDGATRRATVLPFASLLVVLPALYIAQFGLHNEGGANLTVMPRGDPGTGLLLTLDASAYGLGSALGGGFVACTYPQARVAAGPLADTPASELRWVGLLAGALYAAALALRLRRGERRALAESAAFLGLGLATYALIGAGRAGFLAGRGIDVSAAATWARYHYVGQLLLVGALVRVAASRAPASARCRWSLLAWILVLLYPTYLATRDVTRYVPTGGQAEFRSVQAQLAKEIARAPAGRPIVLRNRPLGSIKLGPGSQAAFPGRAAVFVIIYPENRVDGRPVYFLETDAAQLEQARSNPDARSASLLITPAERKDVAK